MFNAFLHWLVPIEWIARQTDTCSKHIQICIYYTFMVDLLSGESCLLFMIISPEVADLSPQMVPRDLNIGFRVWRLWFRARSTTLSPSDTVDGRNLANQLICLVNPWWLAGFLPSSVFAFWDMFSSMVNHQAFIHQHWLKLCLPLIGMLYRQNYMKFTICFNHGLFSHVASKGSKNMQEQSRTYVGFV